MHAMLPASSSHPTLASILSPTQRRKHSRVTSQPIGASSLGRTEPKTQEEERPREAPWSLPAAGHSRGLSSLEEIPEGSRQGTTRSVRFPVARDSPTRSAIAIADDQVSPMTVLQPTSPRSEDDKLEDTIGKASQVVEALRMPGVGDAVVAVGEVEEVRTRLDGIESRQKRIEELLRMLVEQRDSTTTQGDDRAD